MAHCLNVLNREPIQIFGWPLFLPVCIARDYYTLWTRERMQALISAARARNVAIEINDMAHTPDERFILLAKEQGLKFTFGSDSRNANAGRLSYCKAVARRCGLTRGDFYVPRRKGDRT
jgi:histidinol phosphatase-like PHP family hydrolase